MPSQSLAQPIQPQPPSAHFFIDLTLFLHSRNATIHHYYSVLSLSLSLSQNKAYSSRLRKFNDTRTTALLPHMHTQPCREIELSSSSSCALYILASLRGKRVASERRAIENQYRRERERKRVCDTILIARVMRARNREGRSVSSLSERGRVDFLYLDPILVLLFFIGSRSDELRCS